MPDTEKQKNVIHDYIAAFNAGAPDAMAALFSDDATVEDPIGTTTHHGREAIASFYGQAISTGAKISLQGPICMAGLHAAFPFAVSLSINGQEHRIDVIDTFRFDEDGCIAEMRAYFEASDLTSFT
ncbi:MAG: nuclear transport factor 2 family protein [Blastomonas sp.]